MQGIHIIGAISFGLTINNRKRNIASNQLDRSTDSNMVSVLVPTVPITQPLRPQPFLLVASPSKPPPSNNNRELLANVIGGCVQATTVTVTGYPFDLIKARLQTKMYLTSLACLIGTIKNEGLMGLYRGAMMPWISHLAKRPIQYTISEHLLKKTETESVQSNIMYNYLIGGSVGLTGPIIGTPLQVVKVSMQTSSHVGQSQNQDTTLLKTKNSIEYIKYTYRTHGIRGFYRGFIPTAFKDIIFGGSLIGTYYTLRRLIGKDKWYKNFFNGAAAHCFTWCIFMPIDYVKTTIQKNEKHLKIRDVIRQGYNDHGLKVFWRGVIPACIRTIPVSGFGMLSYEKIRDLIMK